MTILLDTILTNRNISFWLTLKKIRQWKETCRQLVQERVEFSFYLSEIDLRSLLPQSALAKFKRDNPGW